MVKTKFLEIMVEGVQSLTSVKALKILNTLSYNILLQQSYSYIIIKGSLK